MNALPVQKLPEGDWLYEVKLDGYRALAFKDGKDVRLISRNNKPLNYPQEQTHAACLRGYGRTVPHRLRTKDGRAFEYVFESGAQPSARSITKEEAIRIATDWMATFQLFAGWAVLRTRN